MLLYVLVWGEDWGGVKACVIVVISVSERM